MKKRLKKDRKEEKRERVKSKKSQRSIRTEEERRGRNICLNKTRKEIKKLKNFQQRKVKENKKKYYAQPYRKE